MVGNVIGENITSSIISGLLLGFRAGELRWTERGTVIMGMRAIGSVMSSPRRTRSGVGEVGRGRSRSIASNGGRGGWAGRREGPDSGGTGAGLRSVVGVGHVG